VYQLQGEAAGVKPTELLQLLQACAEQRLTLLNRHEAVARLVGNLDFNNTYQYVVAREETHLSWLQAAIEELGGVMPVNATLPAIDGGTSVGDLFRQDASAAQAFVDWWQPKIEQVTNARHQGMLRVICGETLEHKRFFEQAFAGREDLLGRRLDAGPRRGAVIGSRWVGD
jgi:bacterioferritin (cytochrome b1)